MGVATVYVMQPLGRLPPKQILLAASKCERIPDAIAIGEKYVERIRRLAIKGETMTNKAGKPEQKNQQQQKPQAAGQQNFGANQIRKLEKSVTQLMGIGTFLQSIVPQLGRQIAAATAGASAGPAGSKGAAHRSPAKRSKAKSKASGEGANAA